MTVGRPAAVLLGPIGALPAHRAFPDARAEPPADRGPGLGQRVGEVRAGVQVARLLAAAPRLAGAPRGDGGPVIDAPGWRAPESAGAPLRRYLRWLGHDAHGWGLGVNAGTDPERDGERLAERVVAAHRRTGRPVALVGWSLGGVLAREAARHVPDAVRAVVTFGSPLVGGPAHTIAAARYGQAECDRLTALVERLDADRPIRVPITAILTRADGVVHWRACIDHRSPRVEHVEVGSTHLGLGLDPDVWAVVADRLAERRRDG